jgi:cell division protein FtsI (penicillin-binding protein 3)
MANSTRRIDSPLRHYAVLALLLLGMAALGAQAVRLHVVQKDFLQRQGDARALRSVDIPAHRGMILDRFGEPLAISTPVASVSADPQEFLRAKSRWPRLAELLGLEYRDLLSMVEARRDSRFVYLKRQVPPERAERARGLEIPGVSVRREYKRYYPAGEVTGHLLGFTNVDDQGLEGIEAAFDAELAGVPGQQQVLKDRRGRIVQALAMERPPRAGRDLALSLDRRIQYLAYRALQDAVRRHRAEGGSLVLLDVRSGEVLALVNQPVFNPNNPRRVADHYRNRAIVDSFEPGSTMKPFTVVAALESGRFQPDTPVDTRPGRLKIGARTIRDTHNYGLIDVARVIQKSSNVGAGRIALALPAERLWDTLRAVGVGQHTGSDYPAEAAGVLADYRGWRRIEHVTLSYGYGLSMSTLQLARAYAVLAADGVRRPVSLRRLEPGQVPAGEQVLDADAVYMVRTMLESVVQPGGTGTRARVRGYRVAGKTGTVHKLIDKHYAKHRYLSVFAGFAPATRPRLAMAVMIDEPKGKDYYGGLVAAPVFRQVMAGALRLLDVAPDDPQKLGRFVALGAAP